MRQTNLALALLTAAVLAACSGGSTGGDQTLKTKFSAQVSFGDSLSDVGTYAVGTVAALHGGKWTINGDNTAVNATLTGKNWTELMAAQLGLPAPCPAMTGLDGAAAQGFSVAAVKHTGCFGYAQGGARVTIPYGPGNKATGSALGALTVPVVTQVQNHLDASGGKFKGDELVLVMAGANDVLSQNGALAAAATKAGTDAGNAKGAQVFIGTFITELTSFLAAGATNPATAAQAIGGAGQGAVGAASVKPGATLDSIAADITAAMIPAAATQPGNAAVASQAIWGPMAVKAGADAKTAATTAGAAEGARAGAAYFATNAPATVDAVGQAAAELVALVKTKIIANGANYVVVNNMPDVATSPSGLGQTADVQKLINAQVVKFNEVLSAGLAGESKVLLVDVFAASHDQATNPGPYGLTNVSTPACDLSPAKNPLGASLACNGSNLIAGDISHYSFADTVHPTPFVYWLLARYVSEKMVVKGWM
ncbi:MAG: esterase [Pseudomonadota bacterium]